MLCISDHLEIFYPLSIIFVIIDNRATGSTFKTELTWFSRKLFKCQEHLKSNDVDNQAETSD